MPREVFYRTEKEIQEFRNPPVGTIVQWFPQADVNSDGMAAGIVTGHEGPGMLALTLLKKSCNPQYAYGVRHVSDPFHSRKSETTMKAGGWDFVPAYEPDVVPLPDPCPPARSRRQKAEVEAEPVLS